MLLDGKKVACATCIKGHRATHCKHKDRPMVEIKKIGRPATQCERCRALRLVRQLHVKCNCVDERQLNHTRITHDGRPRKKQAVGNLRAIAPRQDDTIDDHQQQVVPGQLTTIPSPSKSCCTGSTSSSSSSPTIASRDQLLPDLIPTPITKRPPDSKSSPLSPTTTIGSSCCGSRPMEESVPPPSSSCYTTPKNDPAPSPSSSTCCPSSTTQRNAWGQPIRLVTCRCGDACTCIGCDAHPARAMKSYQHSHSQQHQDPYAGYSDLSLAKRRLSIASICQNSSSSSLSPSSTSSPSPSPTPSSSPSPSPSPSSSSIGHHRPHNPFENCTSNTINDDRPTSVLTENGALLCGCGCNHALDQCTDCFQELCQDYFATH